ncbi:MAG: hypothetical protein Pars2KO_33520 [Parasphingorhabdus sp.]
MAGKSDSYGAARSGPSLAGPRLHHEAHRTEDLARSRRGLVEASTWKKKIEAKAAHPSESKKTINRQLAYVPQSSKEGDLCYKPAKACGGATSARKAKIIAAFMVFVIVVVIGQIRDKRVG